MNPDDRLAIIVDYRRLSSILRAVLRLVLSPARLLPAAIARRVQLRDEA
jgi:hypothetical protein